MAGGGDMTMILIVGALLVGGFLIMQQNPTMLSGLFGPKTETEVEAPTDGEGQEGEGQEGEGMEGQEGMEEGQEGQGQGGYGGMPMGGPGGPYPVGMPYPVPVPVGGHRPFGAPYGPKPFRGPPGIPFRCRHACRFGPSIPCKMCMRGGGGPPFKKAYRAGCGCGR